MSSSVHLNLGDRPCQLRAPVAEHGLAVRYQHPLDRQFEQPVRPFVAKYCSGCHSGQTPAAQFDLKSYTTMDMVTHDFPRWALLLQRLTAKEMPPKGRPQPTDAERAAFFEWLSNSLAFECVAVQSCARV